MSLSLGLSVVSLWLDLGCAALVGLLLKWCCVLLSAALFSVGQGCKAFSFKKKKKHTKKQSETMTLMRKLQILKSKHPVKNLSTVCEPV